MGGSHYIFIDCRPSVVASYQEFGLSNKAPSSDDALVAGVYYFKVNGSEYLFTAVAGDTYVELVDHLNDSVYSVKVADGSRPAITFALVDGDIRCVYEGAATIALTAGTTGTNLFGVGGLSTVVDGAVNAVMFCLLKIETSRATIEQIRINFPIIYTGDITWDLLKVTGVNYNGRFKVTMSSGASSYYLKDVGLICGKDDFIRFMTSAACAGTSYVETSWTAMAF